MFIFSTNRMEEELLDLSERIRCHLDEFDDSFLRNNESVFIELTAKK